MSKKLIMFEANNMPASAILNSILIPNDILNIAGMEG